MPKPQFNGDYSDTDSAATENETEYGEEPNLPLAPRVDDSGNDKTSIIRWSGLNKKFPLLHFSPHILLLALPVECKAEAEKFHLTYKFVKTECKLVRSILSVHCFKEVHPNSSNFNLMWTGSHLKPHTLRGLQDFQKINHFPRSYELTRKDKLYKNIQRMQHGKGAKHFDFIPESYVIPEEFNEFHAAFIKDRKPWIVKPVASSRGRGIYLINHPSQVPLDDNVMVCKYINNPLLVDGYKFDLRLYVGVTCFDPLRIYLYEEGLTRFATVKYDKTGKNLRNSCMHLTNYSVNKKNVDFVSCPDPEVEDYGNKWSMSAMLRFLKQIGKDTTALMMRIEDVVIKTIIAGELHIASACKMFMPYTGNCFEIYGFDILVDENLRPWLLEVNLSPSLACDSPLDLKIKSHLVSDMFNLVGFVAHDPMLRKPPTRRFVDYPVRSRYQRQRTASAGTVLTSSSRPASSVTRRKTDDTLTAEEARVLRHTREEFSRKGGFVRIFPSSDSWELYGSFLEHRTTLNHLLHSKLFPGRKTNFQRPSTACHTSASARTKSITLYGRSQSKNSLALEPSTEMRVCCGNETAKKVAEKLGPGITERLDCYERKLDTWSPSLLRTKALRSTTSSSGGVIAKQATSEISNQESAASRATPDGQVAVNNREESLTSHYPREPTKPQMEPDRRSAYKVSSTAPDQLYHRSFQENARAQKPPIPVSSATISKQVLSSQPRYQPIRVDDIMAKAGTLTKLQARQAFAMYLQRVQQRLNHETSYDSDDSRDSVDSKQDDQMNLVIRFLKKAASNLQQPFKVVVPSQKLRAHDRRRILAKQLGDFVHVYGKETAQLQKRQELNRSYGISRSILNTSEIPDEEFKVFMAIASEAELEDLLTTYTKLNKNASVFLGGRPDRTSQENTTKGPSVDASLSRRKESERLFRSSNPVPDESLLRPTEDLSTTGSNMMDRHARAFSAVSAYGTSVALNRTRQRPVSAKSSGTQGSERAHRACRPVSAKHTRDMSNVEHSSEESRGQDEEVYSGQRSRVSSAPVSRDNNIENQPRGIRVSDEHAVAAALQRLAKRQAARQYSALNSSHQGNNWEHLFKKLDFNRENDGISHNEDEMIDVIDVTKNHVITSDSMSRDRPGTRPVLTHRHDRHASANATFETFVSYDKRPYMNGLNEGPVNWRNDTAEPHHSVSADARSLIHVDLKKEYNRTEESESVSRENGERRSPPVSRDEYNRQMRLISEKLSEEKLRLQQQLQQYPCLPRPPAARPSTRKMVAHKRMIRLAASNPPPVFDVISGMTGMIDDDPL